MNHGSVEKGPISNFYDDEPKKRSQNKKMCINCMFYSCSKVCPTVVSVGENVIYKNDLQTKILVVVILGAFSVTLFPPKVSLALIAKSAQQFFFRLLGNAWVRHISGWWLNQPI